MLSRKWGHEMARGWATLFLDRLWLLRHVCLIAHCFETGPEGPELEG